MQIQISTDSNLSGDEKLIQYFQAELESKLARFSDHLTRLDVHLSDEMGAGTDGEDLRCVIEARPARHQPVAVTNHAGSVADAFNGAVRKLERVLESLFDREGHHKGGESIRHKTEDEQS
ncbi:HPF/RaiA family ribosome-associated protein [Amycolatopsis sp. FDAARGOS 1241]|uniref:HPF/RaiA family ribosome-associated protein n=1 Tax=Amycolatopsis sp. FDAARGOS 1241 TaxID=2778070 RepID=UPI001952860E|nr:HPF/RaiA family ribosome-associated protein [Amycolatopsis sp. FDAARGOS 1241]QRP49059.1 HPF/RaiA family ribosome-associated protein [Amycolatopsis sp. FDAARGOS 1241]